MKKGLLVLAFCSFFSPLLLRAANSDFLRFSGFRWAFVENSEKVYLGYTTKFSRKLGRQEWSFIFRSHLLLLVVDHRGQLLGHLIVETIYGMPYVGKSNLLYQYTVTELPRSARRLIVVGVTDLITSAYESGGELSKMNYSWAKIKLGHINGVISASPKWKPGQQYARLKPVRSVFVPYYDENNEVQTENLMKMESYLEELDMTWDKLFVKKPKSTEEPKDSKHSYSDNECYYSKRSKRKKQTLESVSGNSVNSSMDRKSTNRRKFNKYLNEL